LKKVGPEEAATRTHGTLVALGQAGEAEQFAQRWIAEHPRDAVFPFYLGDRALAEKNHALAETRYRKVLELQPQNALALNNLAWLMVQKQAVERAPDDGGLRVNLARLYILSDQKGMARTELQKVERMGRKYPNQDEVSKLLSTL
jgi:Flp pilus assembly protein TadD